MLQKNLHIYTSHGNVQFAMSCARRKYNGCTSQAKAELSIISKHYLLRNVRAVYDHVC
jgi:hypothetical protein